VIQLATLATAGYYKLAALAMWQAEGEVGWDPISLWKQMGWPARLVVIVLFIMSAWSIGVKSHLAKVVTAGLQEFKAHGESNDIPGEQIEASKRALERAEAIVHAELKRGLGGLATIGSTAPFVGLFGTVIGILNAFRQISAQKTSGLGAVAGGISEALVTTAIGLFVAIPAVMMFNYFTNKVEAFDVEMDNSSSELIDYFLKRSGRR